MKRRLISAALIFALVLVLPGMGTRANPGDSGNETTAAAASTEAAGETSGGETEAAESVEATGGVFRNYLTTDIDTINPHIYTASASADVFGMT